MEAKDQFRAAIEIQVRDGGAWAWGWRVGEDNQGPKRRRRDPWPVEIEPLFQARAMAERLGGEAAPLLSPPPPAPAAQARLSRVVTITWACLSTATQIAGKLR